MSSKFVLTNESHRLPTYAVIVLSLMILTVLSIKWNFAMFQANLHSTLATGPRDVDLDSNIVSHVPDSIVDEAKGGVSEAYVAANIRVGSRVYYQLDSVKSDLISEVQKASRELNNALERPGALTNPDKISRAVMIYLPPDNDSFKKEVKAMYLSIGLMRTQQSSNMKTDYLVFTPESNFAFPQSIGCSTGTVRASFSDPERCILIPHTALVNRSPESSSNPLKDYHVYLNSILILAEFEYIHKYTYILRSDSDCFVTPGFADWILSNGVAIATGRGGYSGTKNAVNHLRHTATKSLGLVDGGLVDIGSTWYGRTDILVKAAQLQVSVMKWLDTQEFSQYERSFGNADGWPHWHWPVLSMYGGHIAINTISKYVQQNNPGSCEMDYPAGEKATPLASSVKHIHCWAGEGFFSKSELKTGKYDGMDLSPYESLTTAAALASVVALSADRMSNVEFVSIVNSKEELVNRKWLKLKPPPGKSSGWLANFVRR